MTGPEHYREAEYLLTYIKDGALQEGVLLSEEAERSIAARAQVHATLALAAATASHSVAHFESWQRLLNDNEPGSAS